MPRLNYRDLFLSKLCHIERCVGSYTLDTTYSSLYHLIRLYHKFKKELTLCQTKQKYEICKWHQSKPFSKALSKRTLPVDYTMAYNTAGQFFIAGA